MKIMTINLCPEHLQAAEAALTSGLHFYLCNPTLPHEGSSLVHIINRPSGFCAFKKCR